MSVGRTILKWGLYILWLLILFAVQSALGYRLSVFGVKPDLMPFLAASVAMLEGYFAGGWFGLLIGVLCDTFHPVGNGFFPIYYFVFSAVCGLVSDLYFRRSYLTVLLWGGVSVVVSNLLQYLIFYAVFDRVGFLYLLKIAGVELFYSLLLSAIAYLPCRAIWRRFVTPEKLVGHMDAGRILRLRTRRAAAPRAGNPLAGRRGLPRGRSFRQ